MDPPVFATPVIERTYQYTVQYVLTVLHMYSTPLSSLLTLLTKCFCEAFVIACSVLHEHQLKLQRLSEVGSRRPGDIIFLRNAAEKLFR